MCVGVCGCVGAWGGGTGVECEEEESVQPDVIAREDVVRACRATRSEVIAAISDEVSLQ